MHGRSMLATVTACALILAACAGSLKGDAKSGRSAKTEEWVLIEYRDIPEKGPAKPPEYIWLAKENLGWFFEDLPKTRVARIAPPEMWGRFGPAPGRIPREYLMAGQVAEVERPAGASRTEIPVAPIVSAPLRQAQAGNRQIPEAAIPKAAVGFVVYAKGKEVVIDLTAKDGLTKGTKIALWREGPPLRHPVTGAYLGDLNEELGTAVVTEVRDKYSVAEVEKLQPGATIRPKDRAGFPAP